MKKLRPVKKDYIFNAVQNGDWFLIMCSWDPPSDSDAVNKFKWVYEYLNVPNIPEKWDRIPDDDPRRDLDLPNLIGLNLIGQRKFVIIGRTTSNRVLQEISSNVTLGTSIRVDVFPATYVHQFARLKIGWFDAGYQPYIPTKVRP